MKKAGKILGTSLLLAFLLEMAAFASDGAKVMEVLDKGGDPVVFVKGIEGEVQSAEALVGNVECPQVSVKSLDEEAPAMQTLILLDNSLSIPEEKRDIVKNVILELIAGRKSEEQFSVGVFGEELQILTDYTDDYVQLKNAIDGIEFVDQDTYLTDVLYDLVASDPFGEEGEYTYHRIFVISDGVDSKSLGYTTEELGNLLADTRIPIYSLGVYNRQQSNSEELKNMFALSRQTNAEYFVLDEMEDPLEIVTMLAQDLNMVRFDVALESAVKDGSRKSMTLRIQMEGGEIEVQADGVRMPQEVAAVPEEEPEKELMPAEEEVKPEEKIKPEEETESEKKINFMGIVLIVIVAVAVIALVVFLILLFTRKKKNQNAFVEAEVPFSGIEDEGRTEIFMGGASVPDDGKTVQLRDQGRNYVLTLTDMSMPARSYQKPIHDKLIIGRSASQCDICIDYDRSVSSRHCAIEKRGDCFFLIDLQSSNGTFLNGSQVLSEVEIYSGSIIKMGRVAMRVEVG